MWGRLTAGHEDAHQAEFTPGNIGGTFRKNWCKCGNRSFDEFKIKLGTYKLLIVSTTMENAMWISSFERDLIALFEPKYNKERYNFSDSFSLGGGGA